jgi:hypothetical protein
MCYRDRVEILFYLIQYMASYTTLQRNIAKLATIALLTFISPLSAVNAATGNINVVTEVSTPTNDTTPNYTFNSDST